MKKLIILVIVLILVVANFSTVLAAPWKNPNGSWLEVDCPDLDPPKFDVWVHSDNSSASFSEDGQVGITKAIYIDPDFDGEYELIWQVPGHGVFKKTVWCTWELEEYPYNMAGDILIP